MQGVGLVLARQVLPRRINFIDLGNRDFQCSKRTWTPHSTLSFDYSRLDCETIDQGHYEYFKQLPCSILILIDLFYG